MTLWCKQMKCCYLICGNPTYSWKSPLLLLPLFKSSEFSQHHGHLLKLASPDGHSGGSILMDYWIIAHWVTVLSQGPLHARWGNGGEGALRWLHYGSLRPQSCLGTWFFLGGWASTLGRHSSLGLQKRSMMEETTWDVSQGKRKCFLPSKVKTKLWIWFQM